MKNCLICHKPLPSGDVLLVLSGALNAVEETFEAREEMGYLCPGCLESAEEPRIDPDRAVALPFRYQTTAA